MLMCRLSQTQLQNHTLLSKENTSESKTTHCQKEHQGVQRHNHHFFQMDLQSHDNTSHNMCT